MSVRETLEAGQRNALGCAMSPDCGANEAANILRRAINDALALLDEMEAERIEVWAREITANCSCSKARTYEVDVDCGHLGALSRNATLIFGKTEPTEGKRNERPRIHRRASGDDGK